MCACCVSLCESSWALIMLIMLQFSWCTPLPLVLKDRMAHRKQTLHIFGGSLFPKILSVFCLVLLFLSIYFLPFFLHIHYGFWVCVFMGFLNMRVCVSLRFYSLCLFLGFFSFSVFVFVLFWFVFALFESVLILSLRILRDRGDSGWERRMRRIGRNRWRENCNQNIWLENNLFLLEETTK